MHLLKTKLLFHRHIKYNIKKTSHLKRVVVFMTQTDLYCREDLWVFQDVWLSGKIQERAAIGNTMWALNTIVFEIIVYQFSMNHKLHFKYQCLYPSWDYKYTQFIWLFWRKLWEGWRLFWIHSNDEELSQGWNNTFCFSRCERQNTSLHCHIPIWWKRALSVCLVITLWSCFD